MSLNQSTHLSSRIKSISAGITGIFHNTDISFYKIPETEETVL